MFTGIVEEMGTLMSKKGGSEASQLTIQANRVLTDVALGDSIAVNGVCLTVVSFTSQQFIVDVMPETLSKTNLGQLQPGSKVNLERAMAVGSRFGGHIVSGHVDGTGTLLSRQPHGNAVLFRIQADARLLRYMIPRGSVTVDGISLTIVDVWDKGFSLSLIPHTLSQTTLQDKHPGATVNLECDMIGKYVERLLGLTNDNHSNQQDSALTLDFLSQHGFA